MIGIRRFNSVFSLISFSILLLIASCFKASFILGSKMAFFSGIEMISPLAGLFGGSLLTVVVLLGRFLMRQVNPLIFFIRHVPGLCGTLYWCSSSPLVRVVLPLFCMILFLVHPVGVQAYAYSFFWLIPVLLFVGDAQGVFFQALGSTFVVHAVGSVIWLYTVPMTALQWWSLIPVVVVERLVFAGAQAMVVQFLRKGIEVWGKYNLSYAIRKQLVRAFSL